MPFYSNLTAHGYGFAVKTEHRQSECSWCRWALDTAMEHMKDANLKFTKSTKHQPDETPHVVHVTRIYRALGSTPPAADPCDLSDDTLRRLFSASTDPWQRAMIEEVTNLRIKLSRQRPVVLDLEEDEAATVLRLLDIEEENQTAEADTAYQNGDGFEGECAQARQLAEEAEKIADRLRKTLGKHLDKAYAGELES